MAYKTSPIYFDSNKKIINHLCNAIVIQAIIDYRDLVKRGIEEYNGCGTKYSKEEIEAFFDSVWCSTLLSVIGGHYDGKYIKNKLKG